MKSREILYKGDEWVELAFKERQRLMKEKNEKLKLLVEANPEFEEMLGKIDFDILKDILLEYVQRSGIKPEDANILGKADIHCLSEGVDKSDTFSPDAGATYDAHSNQIFVNFQFIKKKLNGISFEMILHMIIHELAHAASKYTSLHTKYGEEQHVGYANNPTRYGVLYGDEDGTVDDNFVEENPFPSNDLKKRATRRGVERRVIKKKWAPYLYFEEGVTEKIAREILNEYARRAGLTGDVNKYQSLSAKKRTIWYDKLVEYTDKIIEKISKYDDMPKKTVWDAIKRGRFEKNELKEKEVREELERIFGKDFMKRLAWGNFEDVMGWFEKIRFKTRLKFIDLIVSGMVLLEPTDSF